MMDRPTAPTNIYAIDIDENKQNNCTRITNSLFGNLSENVLIKPHLIKFKSFDGLEIPAFLYKPSNTITTPTTSNNFEKINEKENIKLGAVLSIHGGPTAQERPYYDYSGFYQYLVNNGIVVIAPNFRGSTGYGKSFEKKIYHDWGGNELKDLEYAIKWLLSQDWIDPKRIGVFGGSFGGFATLSCITRLPQYNFKAAVDIVGPSNLITFIETVPEHWKKLTFELVGNPEEEESFLKERSPITFVDNINPITSLLVIQGATDPRVAKSESDQIVKKLKDKGMDVEYLIFEDEGHGFTKYNNQIKALKKSAEFMVEKLS
jgi:dipeptidyl aminopeptidase/acylaminoacyl peptidase